MKELPPLLVNGFLAGHEEILYDPASETRGWADEGASGAE